MGKPRASNRTACTRRKKRRSVARAKARASRCGSYWSKPSSWEVRALRIGPACCGEQFLGKLLATYLEFDSRPLRPPVPQLRHPPPHLRLQSLRARTSPTRSVSGLPGRLAEELIGA